MYAVPHDDKDDVKEEGDIKVMASHAIFRTDGLKKAPGCVVGFQFAQALMHQRFMNITSQVNVSAAHTHTPHVSDRIAIVAQCLCLFCIRLQCNGCIQACQSEMQDCYVIDNNGYILLSEEPDDVGKFFGEAEGRAMQTLVELQIFKAITVYDYQAVCVKEEPADEMSSSAAAFLTVCH